MTIERDVEMVREQARVAFGFINAWASDAPEDVLRDIEADMDDMDSFEDAFSRIEAENARLRRIEEAAREFEKVYRLGGVPYEVLDKAHAALRAALAKEGEG